MSETTEEDRGARRRLDLISALVLVAASLVALLWIIPVYVPGEGSRGGVAPSFFPNLTAGVVLVCAIVLVVVNRGGFALRLGAEGWRTLAELLGWGVLSVALWLLLRHAGFIVASIVGTGVLTVVARYRGKLWLPALIAVLLPVALYYAVAGLFDIFLP